MANKSNTLTVEHLWQCERIGTPSLSPDGAWIVVDQSTYSMETDLRTTQLWLYSTDGKTRKQLTQAGRNNSQPVWSPDGRWVAFSAKREGDDAAQLYVIAPDGGEARRVTDLAHGISGLRWRADSKAVYGLYSLWPELKTEAQQKARIKANKENKVQAKVTEADSYRYWDHWICDGRRTHLVEVTLASGKVKDHFAGKDWSLPIADSSNNDYDVSPNGQQVVWLQPRDVNRNISETTLHLLDLKTRRLKVIDQGTQWLGSPRFSPDGSQIAFLGEHAGVPLTDAKLYLYTLKTQQVVQLLPGWNRGVGQYGSAALQWSPDGAQLYFLAQDGGQQHLYATPVTATAKDSAPQRMVEGGTVSAYDLAPLASGNSALAYVIESIDYPGRLFVRVERADHERRLDRANGFISKLSLGPWESRSFKGWNNEPVQAFICYPPGYDHKKKYPLLQDIHGGPHAAHMDSWHYRWNLQAFAAQGYIVAAVNYHGSSGFGERYMNVIDGSLGHREFSDIEAVTDALIVEGKVDAKKLFAAGGSYGGYMVAWMNGHTDRYKAYVCHAGVYNWVSQIGDDAYLWLDKELGTWPWDDSKRYHAQSAHHFATNFKTPTLVIHGELDYRVPYYQGLEYYNTLRAKGVAARLVVYPDENHWILKPQNSRLWYQEFFAWLKRFH